MKGRQGAVVLEGRMGGLVSMFVGKEGFIRIIFI